MRAVIASTNDRTFLERNELLPGKAQIAQRHFGVLSQFGRTSWPGTFLVELGWRGDERKIGAVPHLHICEVSVRRHLRIAVDFKWCLYWCPNTLGPVQGFTPFRVIP